MPFALLALGSAPVHIVKKVLAVRQKERPAVCLTAALASEPGNWGWHSAVGGHTVKWPGDGRREDDGAVAAPRATVTYRGLAENLHCAASNIHRLQLTFGKEADAPAIRRPERERRPLGAVELLRAWSVHCANPSVSLPSGPTATNARRVPSGETAKL